MLVDSLVHSQNCHIVNSPLLDPVLKLDSTSTFFLEPHITDHLKPYMVKLILKNEPQFKNLREKEKEKGIRGKIHYQRKKE